MPRNEEELTFLAFGAIPAKRRVKFHAGTVTKPPQVELAGAGEIGIGVSQISAADGDPVCVAPWNDEGTQELEMVTDIAAGALVYGAADGKGSKNGVGQALGFIKVGASGSGSIAEFLPGIILVELAASISVADATNLFTQATMEGCLAEVMQAVKTAQYTIQPTLLGLADGTPLAKFVDAEAATLGLAQMASKETVVRWNDDATPGQLMAQFVLPQDLDDGEDVVVHLLGAIVKVGADEADSPKFTVEAYFSTPGADPGADADCGGESGEFLTAANANYQEKTLTIFAADVPAAPGVLTLLINPKNGELPADDFVLLPPWLEVTRKALAS